MTVDPRAGDKAEFVAEFVVHEAALSGYTATLLRVFQYGMIALLFQVVKNP